ncbi:hypothetical protein KCU88_g368, partial [Aureobasidium melanogenum]
MPFRLSCGGLSMTSGAAFSRPKPKAGNDEVSMLIHRICSGDRGNTENPELSWNPSPQINKITSPTLDVNRCKTNRWMLSNMRRPSSTALTMLAKLSSVKTMSDADLATSLPFRPIAMPTSANFSEGESFTPSPVMAANLPCHHQWQGRLDDRRRHIWSQTPHVLGDDADFLGDRCRCRWMVARQHGHRDPGRGASLHSSLGFQSRRECHLFKRAFFQLGSHGLLVLAHAHRRAEVDDPLHRPLGEDDVVFNAWLGIDNRHTLDGAVERELHRLGPAVLLFERLLPVVESVAKSGGFEECLQTWRHFGVLLDELLVLISSSLFSIPLHLLFGHVECDSGDTSLVIESFLPGDLLGFNLFSGAGSCAKRDAPGIQALRVTILPWVSVPVLSEQMLVTPPSASSALSWRTTTLRFLIWVIPTTMVMVRTAIKDSGMMAMPVEMA